MIRYQFYIVAIRKDGPFDSIEHIPIKARNTQEAVDEVREQTGCFEVTDCYRQTKNWF